MATYSSVLAWRIPWTEEPGGLQSIGSQRVSHDGSNLAHMHAKEDHFLPRLILPYSLRRPSPSITLNFSLAPFASVPNTPVSVC